MEQLSSTTSGHCIPSHSFPFLSFLFLFRPDPFSVSRFSPRAKLLMNIGPKYQSTGIRRGFVNARRCICPYITGGLHTPVPLVVTPHESPPFSPVRVHGHARLSRVNSSSFSGYLVALVQLVPFIPPFPLYSCPLDENSLCDTICPLPSSRSQDAPPRAHDIPSHENLIANPTETPGSCCKSFRELTSTVHENYTREAACKHERNNREHSF